MKQVCAVVLVAISCLWSQQVFAVVDVFFTRKVNIQTAVTNDTDEAMSFYLNGSNCRTVTPYSFNVLPHSIFTIKTTWDYNDHGWDSCYTANHYFEYQDAKTGHNRIRVQQSTNSDLYNCLDIKYYLILWIDNAVCPQVWGNLAIGVNDPERFAVVDCPRADLTYPYLQNCPPYDNKSDTLYFGVLIPKKKGLEAAPLPSRPAVASYDFADAGPYRGSCIYNSAAVPPPLNAVWRAVELPELGAAEVTAWLEPCVNLTPRDPYFFWEAEVLAVVRKKLAAPVSSYSYSIPYSYSNALWGKTSSGERVVVTGPEVSTIIIPLRFDRPQIVSPTSVTTANLMIAGVHLSTNNTLPRGGGVVREYYNKASDHYFMTADDFENPARQFPEMWATTGSWWRVEMNASPGLAPVCRFRTGEAFRLTGSRLYTPYATECAALKTDKNWIYENIAFQAALPIADGNCSAGWQPLYRLYNNGVGGSPNHRYTIDRSTRDAMIGKGWTVEGYGPDAVFACMPAPA